MGEWGTVVRIEALVVATLFRRLGGVLVISPFGYLYLGDGNGEGIGMSETE